MIIKELRIKNFRSYYGDNNVFSFSDGLTLILGDNGDGKTTFFEALQWLFNTTIDKGSIDNISEMRKSKLEIGEQDEVSVYLSFEHEGVKSLEKSFTFERTGEGHAGFRIGPIQFKGYETNGIERIQVSGKHLADSCYDAFMQRFSMFKGETELNVMNDKEALKKLVDKFSDIRKFDSLVEFTCKFEDFAKTAYNKEMKSDNRVAKEAKELEGRMDRLSNDITQKNKDIKEKQTSIDIFSTKLEELEANQETSEKYRELEDRRKRQEEIKIKRSAILGQVNYSHSLLDKMWILCAFPSILQEFKQKCSSLSVEKRKLEKDFVRQQAEKIGKLKAVKEIQGTLINGSTELPWYLPNQETMEEMIRDHICKVCNRTVEEGSDAYNYMVRKLEDYKRHVEQKLKKEQAQKDIEQQSLFKNEYIENLHNTSIYLSGSNESQISDLAQEIVDRQSLVERLKKEIKDIDGTIQEIVDEKSRLLIQAGNVSEAVLEKDFEDIKGIFNQKGKAEIRLVELKAELENLQRQMNDCQTQMDELNPSSSQAKTYREVHRVFEKVAQAFGVAKKENLRRFLNELQDKANEYLQALSVNDFHGEIHLTQTADESTEIKLYSSNGIEIKKPSGSQKTIMYISVLFAISDFSQEKSDEDYPLIFDAATSSFGDLKEDGFYNVINTLHKQCIIVTKDFMTKGVVRNDDVDRLKCPVYRISKAEGFNQSNLATIRTTVTKIKD